MERIILHSDLNNFYATAEMTRNPSLRGLPIAVAGDTEMRHGIVLAKSYEAKRFGVATGDTLWQAKLKCPDIRFVPPDFELYCRLAAEVRAIYHSYTDRVESFGMDECWLDVTGSEKLFAPDSRNESEAGLTIANEIRERVKRETGLTVSVGVSFNKTFAKLGSDMKKPDAVTVIPRENFKDIVWPLPVRDLLYVGSKTERKLTMYGIDTIGKLACADENLISLLLGKKGRDLQSTARGLDTSPVLRREELPRVKSVGNGTTTYKDLSTGEEIKAVLYFLCESVSSRLREQRLLCKTVQLGIREYDLYTFERQGQLRKPSRTAEDLFEKAYGLLALHRRGDRPIRSLSVRATSLSEEVGHQLTMFPETDSLGKREELETCIDALRNRYGSGILKRGIVMWDSALSGGDFGIDREETWAVAYQA